MSDQQQEQQPIKTVAVVGTGVIGSSWTALFLAHGLHVIVADPGPGAEEKLKDYLSFIWPQLSSNNNIKSPSADATNYRFVGASLSREDLASVDFVQESSPEKLELKTSLLASLDADTRPHVPICSSTSGLVPSSFVGGCTKAPERVLVAHPWNPPHLMPLVELVPHADTSRSTVEVARRFFRSLGRRPIVLHREAPGFVGNRLQVAVSREAFNLVASGIADPEDVETAVLDALGPRWALTGPFMTATLGGGGNPGGYEMMQQRLGPAARSWAEDMQKVADELGRGEEPQARVKEVLEKVNRRIGKVDTKQLEKERNEVLEAFMKLREAKTLLNTYANRED